MDAFTWFTACLSSCDIVVSSSVLMPIRSSSVIFLMAEMSSSIEIRLTVVFMVRTKLETPFCVFIFSGLSTMSASTGPKAVQPNSVLMATGSCAFPCTCSCAVNRHMVSGVTPINKSTVFRLAMTGNGIDAM